MTYTEIQNEVVEKYRIKLNPCSKCWRRMHAHKRERMVCKWHPKSSAKATFELFHEIGHIENNDSSMRRCEQEYYATVWAIERCKEYGIKIPGKVLSDYQEYINMEYDRGIRRGGKNYPESTNLILKL